MSRPISTQQNTPCSVDSLRSADDLVWADYTQRILRKRFFCLCAGRTVFYGVAATRAPRSGFDCPANFTHYNRLRSIESLGSSDGVVSEHTIPGFLPDSYYLMMQEGGPSTSGAFPKFCQSAPLSDFSHGACHPLFIVTDDSCNGRHLFSSTALFSTDARTFFSRQSNNEISPVVSLSILKNKSAIPGAGRGLRQPAFLLRAALPIAVLPITRTGSPRSFPARSITCRSAGDDPVINLTARECLLRDDANLGRVTRYDPMERAAHFYRVTMESEPQDWILHKGLKGNCGSALHYR